MRSVVSMLLPIIWLRIHWRAPAYRPSDRNSDRVSDANWLSENNAANSRSSDVATVLMAASIENSRITGCERERNGISSSSEAMNTYQITEPMAAMLWRSAGS